MASNRDRLFQLYWRLQRPLTLGVRGIVADENQRVLLVRHTYTPGWHLPGGGVEKRESAQTALLRELQEEANVTATGAMDLLSVHSNHNVFPNDHVLLFRITEWTQTAFKPSREIAEVAFADPLNPPEGVTGGPRRRLNEVFSNTPPSADW